MLAKQVIIISKSDSASYCIITLFRKKLLKMAADNNCGKI